MKVKEVEYDIYKLNDKVGRYIETVTETGGILSAKIVIDDVEKAPISLKVLMDKETHTLDNDVTDKWIKWRVTPETQDGIMEKLAKIGVHEYNPYFLFKNGNGFGMNDKTWIRFKPLDEMVKEIYKINIE